MRRFFLSCSCAALFTLGFSGCGLVADLLPSPDSSGSGGTASLSTKIVPLIGFSADAAQGSLRVATSSESNYADIVFAFAAPSLTGFTVASEDVVEGQTFQQTLLGTALDITVNAFFNGLNGIDSGVRYTGSLEDGTGSIIFELDPGSGNFFYEQKLFINDDLGIVYGGDADYGQRMIVYSRLSGKIDDSLDHALARGDFACLMNSEDPYADDGLNQGYQLIADAEVYLGKWDDSGDLGTGFGFTKGYQNAMESSVLGEVDLNSSLAALDVSLLDAGISYLQGKLSSVAPADYTTVSQIFYKTDAMSTAGMLGPYSEGNGNFSDAYSAIATFPGWSAVTELFAQ